MFESAFVITLSVVLFSAVLSLDDFTKTGSITFGNGPFNRGLWILEADYYDDYYCHRDPNILVPITVIPINDDKIELEWNPLELIKIQYLGLNGFDVDIDKYTLLRTDESNVGIIARIPREKLAEINISGGYQVDIESGFTEAIKRLYIIQDEMCSVHCSNCASPKVNADFTSLPRSSSIKNMYVVNAHLVLKTTAPIHDFRAFYRTSLEIQGDIFGEQGDTIAIGPNASAFVNGNINIGKIKIGESDLKVSGAIQSFQRFEVFTGDGKSILHAGGIAPNSKIDFHYSSPKNFTMIVPKCDNVEFYNYTDEDPDWRSFVKCIENNWA